MQDSTLMAREELGRILREQHYAVLAGDCAGQPQTNLVAFVPSDDLNSIVFSTPRGSHVYMNMLVNPLYLSSSTTEPTDPRIYPGLPAFPSRVKAAHWRNMNGRQWRARYVEKHPVLAEFIADPTTVMIIMDVCRYVIVNRFLSVTPVKPEP